MSRTAPATQRHAGDEGPEDAPWMEKTGDIREGDE